MWPYGVIYFNPDAVCVSFFLFLYARQAIPTWPVRRLTTNHTQKQFMIDPARASILVRVAAPAIGPHARMRRSRSPRILQRRYSYAPADLRVHAPVRIHPLTYYFPPCIFKYVSMIESSSLSSSPTRPTICRSSIALSTASDACAPFRMTSFP